VPQLEVCDEYREPGTEADKKATEAVSESAEDQVFFQKPENGLRKKMGRERHALDGMTVPGILHRQTGGVGVEFVKILFQVAVAVVDECSL
jgi:hypothetical protein